MAAHATTSRSQGLAATLSERSVDSREILEHKLKSWPEFFDLILSGEKTHELRRDDDRDFRVGDVLRLQEFNPKTNRYTGRELTAKITYITSTKHPCALSESALLPGFCILSIKRL